jgi:hypothetical protein
VVRGGEVAARSIGSEEKEAEVVGDGRGSQEEARVNLLRAGERDRGAIGGLDEERELPAHTMDKRRLLRREQIKGMSNGLLHVKKVVRNNMVNFISSIEARTLVRKKKEGTTQI